ncbi:DNA polymerase sliding clamp [Halobium salinum]|uniref:DNA polymerase sliding clamp n=1 Tax=Halobium salinum TaxID=1364940 RepID=A0ABD5PH05_9EURY|nr:DNA polymerase sliding clamp [Halobium salinum]
MSQPTATDRDATVQPAAFDATVEAEPLQTVLDAAAVLVDECIVRPEPDEFRIVATDPATVGIVDATVDAAAFERYETSGARLGVDLTRLAAVVGMADGDDLVGLSLDPERRRLEVRVGDLVYALALVDPDAVRSLPDVVDFSEHFVARVQLDGGMLSRGVDAAVMVSNHVEIGVEKADGDGENGGSDAVRTLRLRAEGDTDSVDFGVDEGDCGVFEVDAGAEARSLFSLSYLSEMNRVVPSGRPVTVRLGEQETPMDLAFDVADGEGRVTFALAPRISRG